MVLSIQKVPLQGFFSVPAGPALAVYCTVKVEKWRIPDSGQGFECLQNLTAFRAGWKDATLVADDRRPSFFGQGGPPLR